MPFCDTLTRKFYEEQCIEGFGACEDVRTEAESQDSTWRAAEQSREFIKLKFLLADEMINGCWKPCEFMSCHTS